MGYELTVLIKSGIPNRNVTNRFLVPNSHQFLRQRLIPVDNQPNYSQTPITSYGQSSFQLILHPIVSSVPSLANPISPIFLWKRFVLVDTSTRLLVQFHHFLIQTPISSQLLWQRLIYINLKLFVSLVPSLPNLINLRLPLFPVTKIPDHQLLHQILFQALK